jgi:hypothetical protein
LDFAARHAPKRSGQIPAAIGKVLVLHPIFAQNGNRARLGKAQRVPNSPTKKVAGYTRRFAEELLPEPQRSKSPPRGDIPRRGKKPLAGGGCEPMQQQIEVIHRLEDAGEISAHSDGGKYTLAE